MSIIALTQNKLCCKSWYEKYFLISEIYDSRFSNNIMSYLEQMSNSSEMFFKKLEYVDKSEVCLIKDW